MGLLSFVRDAGANLFGGGKGNEAEAIKKEIEKALGSNISDVAVRYDNGAVSLQGEAKSQAAKEKAALIAGNVKGVERVDDSGIRVAGAPQQAAEAAAQPAASASAQFYTIKSGDTLSKIAKEFYGDANAYDKIFEANREVIGHPDKIYPGQQIRIPKD
ncbi:MAG: peptidoglycan-binding protein LysM [Rubricoccaceae bacterium]